jgi:glycosyltransferase involved in cell wall biosynthesis
MPRRVIAISAAVEQALVASGVPRARIVHIPSAIDITAVQKVAPWKAAETPCLIAVGALTPEKGHATLIDALALLHRRRLDSRLLLLGDGPERRALVARAKQRGVDSQVEFAGEVPDATSRIAAARLLVQPSHREALGTAVLEAMALGIPVVASRTGGLTELLGGGAGLLVPPGDASALATAIEQLLTTPGLCTEVAGAARVRVAQFDAPGMAEKVAEVYRSALGDT